MTRHQLFMSTILSTGMLLYTPVSSFAADTITKGAATTATTPISTAEVNDPRVAASSFVEHINFARVALAMKNTDLAKQHLIQARNMVSVIQNSTVEQQRVTRLESGRIVYQYDTEYKYHYFPIQTGLVQVKEISNGPVWAKNDLAVTDADIVYLSLDLTDNKAATFINNAETAIAANNLKEADNQLAKLIDSVVTVDSKISMPADKARDNIALARNFLLGKNYDGARYALSHAGDALDEMQDSDDYKSQRKNIMAMRKDVAEMQARVTKKDPTALEQADKKMSKWWGELKSWSKEER
jgi:hypothetical protein